MKDTFIQTETLNFRVKSVEGNVFENFDYDELIAIQFALTERAETLGEAKPLYASYLTAIASKLEALT